MSSEPQIDPTVYLLTSPPPPRDNGNETPRGTAPSGGLDRGDGSLTDAMLAERISAEVLDGRFCWAAGLGWMAWGGMRWKRCDEVSVVETVRLHIVETVKQELPKVADDWRARSALTGLLGRSRINAMTSLARGIVEVEASAFDAHPDLLNTLTGIVDLRTGKLCPHDPGKFLTKLTAVGYVPGATHEDWTAGLKACPPDCLGWFQVRVGQGLAGYMTPDDTMILLRGGGENGKSTVMGTLMEAAGDYHVLVSDRVLMADPGAHPTELMDFRGARLAVAEELPEARRLSVKRLKDVVGTPRMKARYIRQDTTEWDATHSLFLSTNYLPVVEETDHGTWRRLLLLNFPYRFLKPHEKPSGAENELIGDPGLRQRLKEGQAQREAALAWAVEGACRWYASKRVLPEPPDRVKADTRAWREESDLVLAYWSDRLTVDADGHVMAKDLLDDFNGWLRGHGHREWSDKLFVSRFGGHDETAKHRAERKKIRARSGLSRPRVSDNWHDVPSPVPATYWAWLGVMFKAD